MIAGHTRLEAAEQLGLTEVPVRFLDLSEADAHALALADNKLGEISAWDDERLAELLAKMPTVEAAIAGFTPVDVEAILAAAAPAMTPPDLPGAEGEDASAEPAPGKPGKGTDAWAEWKNMPDYEASDLKPARQIMVNFRRWYFWKRKFTFYQLHSRCC